MAICGVLITKPSKIREGRVCIRLDESGKALWREGNSRWALKTGRNVDGIGIPGRGTAYSKFNWGLETDSSSKGEPW